MSGGIINSFFFYFSCGVGAALVQLTAYYLNIQSVTSELLSFGLTSQDVNNILYLEDIVKIF